MPERLPVAACRRSLYEGTVVGYKKICRFAETTASRIRLTIDESRWSPTLSGVGVYRSAWTKD